MLAFLLWTLLQVSNHAIPTLHILWIEHKDLHVVFLSRSDAENKGHAWRIKRIKSNPGSRIKDNAITKNLVSALTRSSDEVHKTRVAQVNTRYNSGFCQIIWSK